MYAYNIRAEKCKSITFFLTNEEGKLKYSKRMQQEGAKKFAQDLVRRVNNEDIWTFICKFSAGF